MFIYLNLIFICHVRLETCTGANIKIQLITQTLKERGERRYAKKRIFLISSRGEGTNSGKPRRAKSSNGREGVASW